MVDHDARPGAGPLVPAGLGHSQTDHVITVLGYDDPDRGREQPPHRGMLADGDRVSVDDLAAESDRLTDELAADAPHSLVVVVRRESGGDRHAMNFLVPLSEKPKNSISVAYVSSAWSASR